MKTIFFCFLKRAILRTQETIKTKTIPFIKHIFSIFCFQKHKMVLENNNQTNPKDFANSYLSLVKFGKIQNILEYDCQL